MKFLITGLGSAGQRHVRNIKTLLGDEAIISAYRAVRKDLVIDAQLNATFGRNPEDYYDLKIYDNLEKALAEGQDVVVITNPISMHIDTALQAARSGCHVFVEKPLSDNWEGIDELQQLVTDKHLVTFIGYQLRFHPGLQKVRQYLVEGEIGNIIAAYAHFGEYLPGCHPYEDYRESHAARKDQGGGVILCFSHDIDNVYWLFGMPLRVFAVGGHLTQLELDVEDMASMTLEYIKEDRKFPVHVHLDFIQRPARRWLKIIGEFGTIEWDYYENSLVLQKDGITQEHTFDDFERNQMFLDEMSQFLDSIKNSEKPLIPLEEGIDTLRIALAAKTSINSGDVVTL